MYYLILRTCSGEAQLAEHSTDNRAAVGSSPTGATTFMEEFFMDTPWYDIKDNWWLNSMWFVSGIVWGPIYLIWCLVTWDFSQDSKPKWLRWWGNRVDNFPDQFKEWVHCHPLPGNRQINISFLMKNRETYGKLIRPDRDPDGNCWSNCDPEDCE